MITIYTFNFFSWTLISREIEVKFFTSDNELIVRATSDKDILFSATFTEDSFTITESAFHLVETTVSVTKKTITFSKVFDPPMLYVEGEFDAYTEY